MIEKDLNWVCVVICAVQRALTFRTYTNYAIRDHVLNNLQHLPSQYRIEIAEDINRALSQLEQDRPETVEFWKNFMMQLMKEEN